MTQYFKAASLRAEGKWQSVAEKNGSAVYIYTLTLTSASSRKPQSAWWSVSFISRIFHGPFFFLLWTLKFILAFEAACEWWHTLVGACMVETGYLWSSSWCLTFIGHYRWSFTRRPHEWAQPAITRTAPGRVICVCREKLGANSVIWTNNTIGVLAGSSRLWVH